MKHNIQQIISLVLLVIISILTIAFLIWFIPRYPVLFLILSIIGVFIWAMIYGGNRPA